MVERQIVALEGVGSTPIIHPIFLYLLPGGDGASLSGKARDFDSRIRKVRILPPQPSCKAENLLYVRTRGFLFYLYGREYGTENKMPLLRNDGGQGV